MAGPKSDAERTLDPFAEALTSDIIGGDPRAEPPDSLLLKDVFRGIEPWCGVLVAVGVPECSGRGSLNAPGLDDVDGAGGGDAESAVSPERSPTLPSSTKSAPSNDDDS